MENDYLQGQNDYPTSMTAAFNLLTNWKQDPRNFVRTVGPANNGVSFTNVEETPNDADGVALANAGQKKGKQTKGGGPPQQQQPPQQDKSHITCHRCLKKGHYAPECEEYSIGKTMVTDGVGDDSSDDNQHYQFLQYEAGTTLQVATHAHIPKTWILLDNQSTINVFQNDDLLENICEKSNQYGHTLQCRSQHDQSDWRPTRVWNSMVPP